MPSILAPRAIFVPGDDRARLTPADGWIPFGDVEQAIPTRFALQVRRHADRPAVRMGAACLSYRELAARAYRIAHAILARRGDREEPVALLLEQGPGLVAAVLGALAAGKIYVPLDPAHPPERNRRALADAEPALLLASSAEAGRARAWMSRDDAVLDLGALDPGLPRTDPRLELKPDRLAYIFYTSGSTGRPKGVTDCHRKCCTTSCATPTAFASAARID
ncbi:MAG TPA: AMP-binding protein [Geminicoccaceae bacterium]|nr:AMP-binding protein [Geminicoccaceae bacterium]